MTRMSEEDYMMYLSRTRKPTPAPERKQPKYHNKRIRVDGILFDSQLEANYYGELKLRLQAGDITGFCRQATFILQEGFGVTLPITYRADFIVFNLDGTAEIIDTKGMETESFKLKRKMFEKKFKGLQIKLVGRG